MRSSMSVTPPVSVVDEDAARLAELGYKQELHRGMSGFSNFAVSFSIISVLAGCITSFGLAMSSGGPIAISLGWPLVGVFVLCVALAMGEICSFATVTWFVGGRQHFMKEVPPGHDTKPIEEIFNL